MSNKIVVNLGSGTKGSRKLPRCFLGWREYRVDADAAVEPDLVSDVTDLSIMGGGSVDAVWMSHCIEHLYQHQVGAALKEIRRILRTDGFVCITTPDLQAISKFLTEDRLHEVIYQSNAGPVTAHDMMFGYGPDIASGRLHMAHKCGFTPTVLANAVQVSGFNQFVIRRRPTLELAVVARNSPWPSDEDRDELIHSLEL